LDSNRLDGFEPTVVGGLELRRWDIVESSVQLAGVEPVHPPEGGQLNVVDVAPRPAPADELGLVEAVDGLGEGVIEAVADGADGRQGLRSRPGVRRNGWT
jgi:hypothetical protein